MADYSWLDTDSFSIDTGSSYDEEPTYQYALNGPEPEEQEEEQYDWLDSSSFNVVEPEEYYSQYDIPVTSETGWGYKTKAAAKRGGYDALGMLAKAPEAIPLAWGGNPWDLGADDWIEDLKRKDPNARYTLDQYDSIVAGEGIGVGYQAIESIPTSGALMVPYIFGPYIGTAASAAMYGGSTAVEGFEYAKSLGADDETARSYGRLQGGAGGTINTVATWGELFLYSKVPGLRAVKGAAKGTKLKQFSEAFKTKDRKQFATNMFKTSAAIAGVEPTTELFEEWTANQVDQVYGFSTEGMTKDQVKNTVAVAGLSSAAFGIFGLPISLNTQRRMKALLKSKDQRVQKDAATKIVKDLRERGFEDEARAFTDYAAARIVNNEPINIDETLETAGSEYARQFEQQQIEQEGTTDTLEPVPDERANRLEETETKKKDKLSKAWRAVTTLEENIESKKVSVAAIKDTTKKAEAQKELVKLQAKLPRAQKALKKAKKEQETATANKEQHVSQAVQEQAKVDRVVMVTEDIEATKNRVDRILSTRAGLQVASGEKTPNDAAINILEERATRAPSLAPVQDDNLQQEKEAQGVDVTPEEQQAAEIEGTSPARRDEVAPKEQMTPEDQVRVSELEEKINRKGTDLEGMPLGAERDSTLQSIVDLKNEIFTITEGAQAVDEIIARDPGVDPETIATDEPITEVPEEQVEQAVKRSGRAPKEGKSKPEPKQPKVGRRPTPYERETATATFKNPDATDAQIAKAREVYRRLEMPVPEKDLVRRVKPDRTKRKEIPPISKKSVSVLVAKSAREGRLGEGSLFAQAVDREYASQLKKYNSDKERYTKPTRTAIAEQVANALADAYPKQAEVIKRAVKGAKDKPKKPVKRTMGGISWTNTDGAGPATGIGSEGAEYKVDQKEGQWAVTRDGETIGTYKSKETALRGTFVEKGNYSIKKRGTNQWDVVNAAGQKENSGAFSTKKQAQKYMRLLNTGAVRNGKELERRVRSMSAEELQKMTDWDDTGIDLDAIDDYLDALNEPFEYENVDPEYGALPDEAKYLNDEDLYDRTGKLKFHGEHKTGKAPEFFHALLKKFGLNTMHVNVVDIGVFMDDPAKGAANLFPDNPMIKVDIIEKVMELDAQGATAATVYEPSINEAILFVNSDIMGKLSAAENVEVMSHEAGHTIKRVLFHAAPKKTQDAILDEYFEYLRKNIPGLDKMTRAELDLALRPRLMAEGIIRERSDSKNEATASDAIGQGFLDYITSFEEWFADQMAKWTTSTKEPQSLADKFFKGVADIFKQLYAMLNRQAVDTIAQPEFSKFMDRMVKRAKEGYQNAPEMFTAQASMVKALNHKADSMRKDLLGTIDQLKPVDQEQLNAMARAETSVEKRRLAADRGIVAYTRPENRKILGEVSKAYEKNNGKAKMWFKSLTKMLADWFESGIDALAKIDVGLERIMNRYTKRVSEKNAEYKRELVGYANAYNKLDKLEKMEFTQFLYQGNKKLLDDFMNEPGREDLKASFPAMQNVLKDIKIRSEAVGITVDEVDGLYFPRAINDMEGLMAHMADKEPGVYSLLDNEIEQAKRRADKAGVPFTEYHEQQIVGQFLATGRYYGILRKPGALKERSIEALTPDMMPYYGDSLSSLYSHILKMNDHIGIYETIGSQARMKTFRKHKAVVRKIEEIEGRKAPKNKKVRKRREAKLKELNAEAIRLGEQLNSTEEGSVFENTLGTYINRKILGNSQIASEKRMKAMDIMRARFLQRGMYGPVNDMRNVGLITTLGDPTSTLTQLGDLVLNIYANGTKNALASAFNSIALRQSHVSAEMLDIANQQKEFQNEEHGTAKWVANILKWTGFSYTDVKLKEAFMTAAIDKARKMDDEQLKQEWGDYFGSDFEAFKKELRVDPADYKTAELPGVGDKPGKTVKVPGDLVMEMAWAKQMRFQPLDVIANPKAYMEGGNARIFYMLKTFQLRQMNAVWRETVTKGLTGGPEEKVQALKNFAKLSVLITMGNAGVDELKDMLMGRKVPFKENLADQLLNFFLLSRYDMERIQKEGLGKILINKIAPPLNWLDYPYKDAQAALKGDPTLRTIKLLPGGRTVYSRFSETGRTQSANIEKETLRDRIKKDVEKTGAMTASTRAAIRSYNSRVSEDLQLSPRSVRRTVSNARREQND